LKVRKGRSQPFGWHRSSGITAEEPELLLEWTVTMPVFDVEIVSLRISPSEADTAGRAPASSRVGVHGNHQLKGLAFKLSTSPAFT